MFGSRFILMAGQLTLTRRTVAMQSITSKRGVLRGDTRRPAEVTQGCDKWQAVHFHSLTALPCLARKQYPQ